MNAARDSWTAYAEAEGLLADRSGPAVLARRGNKYHAEPLFVDGRRFDSRREGARYLELRLMEKAGLIADLELQPEFPLLVMELWRSQIPIQITKVGRYRADFRYVDLRSGEIIVEDTKAEPTKTEAFRLRKKLAEAIHGIFIREV